MKKKIPRFKSGEEMVAFWDAHDFTDYVGDTEPANDVVSEKSKKDTVAIRLEKAQIQEVRRLAHKVGLGYTSLLRSWITEKLARIHSAQHHQGAG